MYTGTDSKDRKVDGTAAAQLAIGRTPTSQDWQVNVGQQLARLLAEVVDTIISVQLVHFDASFAIDGEQSDFCRDRTQERDRIATLNRVATWAARGYPADRSLLLHAEVDGLAPLFRLVVVPATGIEQQVAPDRAHVSQQRRGDQSDGIG